MDAARLHRGRLRSVDALRGLAALAVVLYHAFGQAVVAPARATSAVSPLIFLGDLLARLLRALFAYGYTGVFLFFIISGFCIHLQWARAQVAAGSGQDCPAPAFLPFWRRRLWRLYPPYVVALCLYLLHTLLTSGVRVSLFNLYDAGLHLLMLHNLDVRTCYSLNSVFWTLAIEEQLYLAYFLLLFLRRRWGWTLTLCVCAAARVGWYLCAAWLRRRFGVETPLTEAAAVHWFTWALGALGVEAAVGLVVLPKWCRSWWAGAAALAFAIFTASVQEIAAPGGIVHDGAWLLMHPAWGLGFFIVVNRAVAAEHHWQAARLGTPRLVAVFAVIGVICYSLYLTHPLVLLQAWQLDRFGLPTLFAVFLIIVPACLLFAKLFFQLCERPFLPKPTTVKSTLGNAPLAAACVAASSSR